MAATDLRAVGSRVEALVGELQTRLDPVAWRRVEEVLGLVTELYGGGLAAVLRAVGSGEAAGPILARMLDDELVASLLVLHGLHPRNLRERIEAALDEVRPYLGSHGGDVEILEVDGTTGAVRLRLLGSCDGCPSSSATLRHAVERAIGEAAPEVTHLDVEGAVEPEPPAPPALVATPVALTPKPGEPAFAQVRQ